jgi:hypothetical protein
MQVHLLRGWTSFSAFTANFVCRREDKTKPLTRQVFHFVKIRVGFEKTFGFLKYGMVTLNPEPDPMP